MQIKYVRRERRATGNNKCKLMNVCITDVLCFSCPFQFELFIEGLLFNLLLFSHPSYYCHLKSLLSIN